MIKLYDYIKRSKVIFGLFMDMTKQTGGDSSERKTK